MPDVLPPHLYLQQLKKKTAFITYNTLRATLVFAVWLTFLPYFTVWIWRAYFRFGHSVSKQFIDSYQLKDLYEKQLLTEDSLFQEYKTRMNLQSFISDCFEGQIITGAVVIAFVALFLLKEWVVQNLPAIDEAEHARAVNQLPPAILEPMFQEDLPDHLPDSPVAEEEDDVDAWLDYISSSSSSAHGKLARAASMPPLSSGSGSGENPFRRSASMEPLLNTPPPEQEIQQRMGRGNPPYAPIVRNADAPRMHIQPIAEEPEEEHPFLQRPAQNNPILARALREEDEEDEEDEDEDENEDAVNFGEDIEGVMEAIGMQGNLWMLAQNATLMAVLIAFILFIIVCLPYTLGVVSILSIGKDILKFPLDCLLWTHRHIGKVTDPLIDPLLTAYFDYLWPTLALAYEVYLMPWLQKGLPWVPVHAPEPKMADGLTYSGMDHVILFYNQSKPVLESMYQRYQAFALGETLLDRISCILVGYLTIGIVTCLFLFRSKTIYAIFGDTAKEVMREYLIIMKLTMFIAIELIVFPLVCGAVLDLSTLPLFEGASVAKRIDFLVSSPVSSVFMHWFLGTGFMFLFAVFVTLCRNIVRPGVMWFIRDPTDPQFHPLREIVERPVLFQYQKIGSSGLVYVFTILVCIGGVVHTIDWVGHAVLPLRWSISTPLSTVPIDLLTTQLILPAAIGYLQPKRVMKKWFVSLIIFCCEQLRLSSFIFGERRPEEEGQLVYHTWSAWFRNAKMTYYPRAGDPINIHGPQVSYIWHGEVLRVPSHDRVPVIPNRRMLVPVDPFIFEPLDEAEKNLGHPASTAEGGDDANTTLVYTPPHFYKRVFIFVIVVWLVSTMVLCLLTFVPLVVGRGLFQHVFSIRYPVHDVYSYSLGASLFLIAWTVLSYLAYIAHDIYRQRSLHSKLKRFFKHLKRCILRGIRWSFFLTFFGLVLPLAFGTVLELYFALPTRGIIKEPVELKIIPAWANGVAAMAVAHGLVYILPENRWRTAVQHVFQRGIGRMNIQFCFTHIIRPLLQFCAIAIFAPLIMAYIDKKITDSHDGEPPHRRLEIDSVRLAYPIALVGSGFYYLMKLFDGLERSWEDRIREETYLVGRLLHNLDS
ncbi:hypothetical protein BY458DRAFT_555583 [Sporodiniella umbellata]|nr:hypothetical protein BY458DRAFT_555583 [Sporodiniella umbellata]